jgi:capsular exopolysaccharide synthesis family protein
LDLRRVLELLRRRKLAIVVSLLLALVAALILPSTLPEKFQATAKVAIQKTPAVLDFGANFMPETPGSRRSPLAPTMEVVLSDRVLGRVVDQLPAPPATPPPGLRLKVLAKVGLRDQPVVLSNAMRRQQRINGLRGAIHLEGGGGGSVLMISAERPDPAHAAFLANAVTDAFLQYERDQRQAALRSAVAWLSQKTAELREKIHQGEEAMAGLVTRIGTIPRADVSSRDGVTGGLSDQLQQVKFELLVRQLRKAELDSLVSGSEAGKSDSDLIALRNTYDEIKQSLDTVRLLYTPTHPEVRRLEAILSDLEARLGPNPVETHDSFGADPLQELQELNAETARLETRAAVLERVLRSKVDSTAGNAATIAEYDRLERDVAINRQMLQVLIQRRNETLLSGATEGGSSRVLDYATVPIAPFSPDRRRVLTIGVAMAFAFALGMGVLKELLDPNTYDGEGVAKALGVPLMGTIPTVTDGTLPERPGAQDGGSLVAESYRNLRTLLSFASCEDKLRSLLVTSAVAGQGKTTVSINLALSFARAGQRVLLLDADLRRPRLDRILAVERSPGLSELLQDDVKQDPVVRLPVDFEVEVLTSGEIPRNPSELIGDEKFELLLSRLVHEYDLVVIDAPVLLAVSDALLLAHCVDGVLLVHTLGSVDKKALGRMHEDLQRAGANVLGVVLNKISVTDPYQYPPYLRSPYVVDSRRWRLWRGRRARGSARS